MVEGWKPLCEGCFEKMTSGFEEQEGTEKKGGVGGKEEKGSSGMILPEDAAVLEGRPEEWRRLWERSEIRRRLEREKKWPDEWAT